MHRKQIEFFLIIDDSNIASPNAIPVDWIAPKKHRLLCVNT